MFLGAERLDFGGSLALIRARHSNPRNIGRRESEAASITQGSSL
jgi:hypothetical protein